MDEMQAVVERLLAAAEQMEAAVERAKVQQETVERIVAQVESEREAELEQKLRDAEATIAELKAAAATAERKTTGPAAMVGKYGADVGGVAAGGVDEALRCLSIEQRIAVKAELMRAGLVG